LLAPRDSDQPAGGATSKFHDVGKMACASAVVVLMISRLAVIIIL
jgi:hypothetical protein